MKEDLATKSSHRLWAEFRYSVVGRLFASPPDQGDLVHEIKALAEKEWLHPISRKKTKFGFSTIESWYYRAKKEKRDPVDKLRTKNRSDIGLSRSISEKASEFLKRQYSVHPSWSAQLHSDNLKSAFKKNSDLGIAPPSYPSVLRYMKANNLRRQRKIKRSSTAVAINRVESREVRSYEVEHVNALWHLDYHHGSIKVLAPDGTWQTPILLGIFDDHSRLACHMQWYLYETADNLVHGFSQALLKRGLPRSLLNDNGSAMISDEFTSGLERLGILAKNTLPESPYQNGKCEHVWTKVEGRLIAMLENYKDLSLKNLNDMTQAWVDIEYNKKVHEETKERPIDRFINNKNVGRVCPPPEELRLAFRREIKRKQRHSDGSIILHKIRFEIPTRFRNLDSLLIKYAKWDLTFVHMLDPRTGKEICPLYPVDKAKNADGIRRAIDNPVTVSLPTQTTILPPLLDELMDEYQSTGLKPAYLPKDETLKVLK